MIWTRCGRGVTEIMPRRKGLPPESRRRAAPPPETPVPLSRSTLGASVGVFLFLFLVYHATLIRTVINQDSGELVAAAHVLGIAHPTGYPLWVLLGRVFDFLPVGGTSAYRVALLSAVASAAAAAIVTALAIRLARNVAAGALAGVAFGLWFPVWSQAVRAEVYGLTALLAALAIAAVVRWDADGSPRALAWLALAVGFVSMHHRTAMLAVAPALFVAVLLTKPRQTRWYLAAAGLFLAPFAFYLYLPIRAAARPPVNWTDPVTWDRFRDHVLASQYTGYAFSHTFGQMGDLFERLLPELLVPNGAWATLLALIAVPFAAWGWRQWFRRRPTIASSLLAGAALVVYWVLQWGETTDLKVFFGPAGGILALCGAVGMAAAGKHLASRAAAMAAGLAVCAVLLVGNWGRSDLSNLWQHRDRWVAMLSSLEPDAIFISDNDVPSFATMYLQTVEEMRPDVTLIRVVPLQTDWYVGTLEDETLWEATRAAWAETETALAWLAAADMSRYKWDRTAVFAYLLAQRLDGRRPVYALHGSRTIELAGPPYFVGIGEDLVALRAARPGPVRAEGGEPAAEFPGGIALVEFELARREVGTGELAEFRSRWRVPTRLPGPAQFAVRLVPREVEAERFTEELTPNGRFAQAFPLLASQWDLAPLPEGQEFEQRGTLIVPTNCPPGPCAVEVGIGPLYSPENVGWTAVGEIEVRTLPAPTNKP